MPWFRYPTRVSAWALGLRRADYMDTWSGYTTEPRFTWRADRLDAEWGYSDRDQRHRVNAWLLARAPWQLVFNNRISYYSAQPTSEKCTNNQPSGERAAGPGDRICANGTVLQRNTLRKDNELFSWDVRISRPFRMGSRGALEAIVEVFNVTNQQKQISNTAIRLIPDANFGVPTARTAFQAPRNYRLTALVRF